MSKLFLSPQVASSLGDDTFWLWVAREWGAEAIFGVPERIEYDDLVLQYSTMGPAQHPQQSIALLWELHPEMKQRLNDPCDDVLRLIYACAESARWRTIASPSMLPYYEAYAPRILPIGVDTDLFRPSLTPTETRAALRDTYGIPRDAYVYMWGGTTHPMKGFDLVEAHANAHPETFWICAWKWEEEGKRWQAPGGCFNTFRVPQTMLSQLMRCADAWYSTGRLVPYFLIEWEAMACGLPFVDAPGITREFPVEDATRVNLFRLGWSRQHGARDAWAQYFDECRAELRRG